MNLLRRFCNSVYVGANAWRERHVPFWPLERIERLQARRVRAIVRHAYEAVPFYREVMQEAGLKPGDFETAKDLVHLPLLDDGQVRRHGERFLSRRHDDRSRLLLHSTGSMSNVQKTIYRCHQSLLLTLAFSERDRAVLNSLMGKGWGQRQLFILPEGSATLAVRAFWDRATILPPKFVDRHFFAPEAPLEKALETINAIKPQVIFSYGSYADIFARWLAARNLPFNPPRVWMYGADMLSPFARHLLEKRFGCIVYTTYQASETGKIGFQCERREGFHLNVDSVVVRVVDESGNDSPPGQFGEVVVSNLCNRAMVLLNCRLGDRAAFATAPCPCGRSLPLLQSLEGRCSEVIEMASGRTMSACVLGTLFEHELHEVLAAQATQPAKGVICWRLVSLPGTDREALRARILAKAPSILEPGTKVSIEFVEKIPTGPGGKLLRAVRAG
ncbi:MAG: phenylacetate--CoA ligase family protein [Verrucomicrobia bacterium]|nr:phenylacetate--CoA ligase family protein [Verrucomicrobiota bacterium]